MNQEAIGIEVAFSGRRLPVQAGPPSQPETAAGEFTIPLVTAVVRVIRT
jgi:hypothetical protein